MLVKYIANESSHSLRHSDYSFRQRSRSTYRALALLLLVLTAPLTFAETMYITDILRLGLHASSDTSDKAFKILVSGDALEVLERNTFYARVRTPDGDEGWVKASYLVSDKPSQAMLKELTTERNGLKSELTTLQRQLSDQDSLLTQIRDERDTFEQAASSNDSEVATLRASNQELSGKIATKRFSIPLLWVIVAIVLALVGGFVGGWWWTDARQRSRHGGYRI